MRDTNINKCVCADLTEITSASLTLSTIHQVVLFHVSLSTSCELWYPELLVKWKEKLLQHHFWVHCHLHLQLRVLEDCR